MESKIRTFCQHLKCKRASNTQPLVPKLASNKDQDIKIPKETSTKKHVRLDRTFGEIEHETQINREDLQAFSHWLIICSNYYPVQKSEQRSLVDLGSMGTVEIVDQHCSSLQFLTFLSKIGFQYLESLCLPATNLISFQSLDDHLFKLLDPASDSSTELALRMMALGSYLGYWELVNPYDLMIQSEWQIRHIITQTSGGLFIQIKPNYLSTCLKFVQKSTDA